ncbi:Transposase-associated domain [Abeliophyllum distichum]|uniref:Transposase-associated domain n=1 Tax=Abeliophyllum distichum TaxID=126358 RepID=A0ABD1RTG6_9LAMI
MVRPLAKDQGFISFLCTSCLNRGVQLVDDVKVHIFNFGFLEIYEKWIHHGRNENDHAHVRAQNEGIAGGDEMMDVLNNIIGDDSTGTDDHYDEFFEALHLEL